MDYARAKSEPFVGNDSRPSEFSAEILQDSTHKQRVETSPGFFKVEEGTGQSLDYGTQPSSQKTLQNTIEPSQIIEDIPKLSTISQLLHLQEDTLQGHLAALGAKSDADSSALFELMNRGFSHIYGRLDELGESKAGYNNPSRASQMQVKFNEAIQAKKVTEQNHQQLQHRKVANKAASLEEALNRQNLQRHTSDGSPLANSGKATDSSIQSKWKQLQYNIRSLAFYLAKFEPGRKLDDLAHHRMRQISTSYWSLLKDDDYRESIIQAYLWTVIQQQVFHGAGRAWAGENGFYMKIIKDEVIDKIGKRGCSDTLQRAARWIAQGSTILDELWERDHQAIKSLVNTETNYLTPFWERSPTSQERPKVRVWEEMLGIFTTALELDRMLMGSKAMFQIYWVDDCEKRVRTKRYNEANMEAVIHERKLSPQSIVQFVVSPMLYKVGNADGECYDTRMLLSKASVVCN